MGTFNVAYLAVGFAIGFGLFAWAALSAIRRHRFRATLSGVTRQFFVEDLPLYPRVPLAAWLGIVALPVIAIWATVGGGGTFWPGFLILFWGIGLVMNAWDVFYRSYEDEGQIQAEIERLRRHAA